MPQSRSIRADLLMGVVCSAALFLVAGPDRARADVYIGYSLGLDRIQSLFAVEAPGDEEAFVLDGLGGLGQGIAVSTGYEWVRGRLCASLELDIAVSSAESSLRCDFMGYDARGHASVRRTFALGVLVGCRPTSRSRFYLRVGYGTMYYSAAIASRYWEIDEQTSGEVQSVVLGVGSEVFLTDLWSARLEYQHRPYDRMSERDHGFTWSFRPEVGATRLGLFRRFPNESS